MGSLQNQVRDFKGLARKPLCYRYTIPQWNTEPIQLFTELSGSGLRGHQQIAIQRRSAVLLARCRPWQTRGDAVFKWPTGCDWRAYQREFQGHRNRLAVRNRIHLNDPIVRSRFANPIAYPKGIRAPRAIDKLSSVRFAPPPGSPTCPYQSVMQC